MRNIRGDMAHKQIENHALEITVSQSATSTSSPWQTQKYVTTDCCWTTQRVAHSRNIRNIQKGSVKFYNIDRLLFIY